MNIRLVVLILALFTMMACEKDPSIRGDGGGGSDTDTNNMEEAPPGCGNGLLTDDEECDDGNTESGDGCAGNCLAVASGYTCNPPGQPCRLMALCGDGLTNFPEMCDDGNLDEGDGCSDLCKVEIGFKCTAPTDAPSACVPTVCGDGNVEGAEGCDDSNDIPFDGCSANCQLEPQCDGADGSCTSDCGDGLVLGDEQCDDGNNLDQDGCSADCRVEEGYTCLQEGCDDAESCVLEVHAVYRDFTASHPDFGVGCDGLVPGMVEARLDANWKPSPTATAASACATSLGDWYTAPVTKVGTITLYPDGTGNYVNRYGENGEQWMGQETQPFSDQPCTGDDLGVTCLPCRYTPTQSCGIIPFDGNPVFFPVDEAGTDMFNGKIPEQYGYDGWPDESEIIPGAPMHNFYFTTEVTYWFAYDSSATSTLNFTGDDDVWVFVNGQRVVDLGGLHVPTNGSVTIDATNSFDMTDGNVYRINIFHAERKRDGSSFKLTLGGFNTARSECRPECGDGVIGLGEECDDGVNDGGYGECGEGCKLDQYCGDGIVQEAYERCDDGNFIDNDGCPSSCRVVEIE